MSKTVIQELATRIDAIQNLTVWLADCDPASPSAVTWRENLAQHQEAICWIEKHCLPSGSGFDSGCTVDVADSGPNHVVIATPFHHMDEHGSYVGWSNWRVTAEPDFVSVVDVTVLDGDDPTENEILGHHDVDLDSHDAYLGETMHAALTSEFPADALTFHLAPGVLTPFRFEYTDRDGQPETISVRIKVLDSESIADAADRAYERACTFVEARGGSDVVSVG